MTLTASPRPALAGGFAGLALLALFIGTALSALWLETAGSGFAAFSAVTFAILRFTLWQAGLSTLLSLGFALPVALALARQRRFAGRQMLIRLMAIPLGLPVLIGALGLLGIWGRHGLVNQGLAALGLEQPISIYGLPGILLAHVFFNMPLATRLLLAGLERIPAEYWRMAASLGMGRLAVLRLVEWPAMSRLIPGIAGLIFMLCATSFTLVLVLGGGPGATTLEVAIYQALRFDFDPPLAVSLAGLQLLVTGLLLLIFSLWPAPEEAGLTDQRPIRRFDGEGLAVRLADYLVLLIALIFVAAPLVDIAAAGLKADLGRLLADAAVHRAIATSLAVALPAGCLSVMLGFAFIEARMALQASRSGGRGARALIWLIDAASSLVLLVPAVVLATGWFLLLRRLGEVSAFAAPVVVVINAMMALPFAMRVLQPAMEVHHQRNDRLALSLGLSGFSRLRRLDWPALRRPFFMALSFAMALSLGDLGAVALFGADQLTTLPWLIFARLGSYRSTDADGLALLLGLLCLVFTLLGTAGKQKEEPS
ncbi:thiamine/thiamine pyrophosphate ABC transporter permease [Allorhizobium undicola]|uniref:thiamine/thiamine pyrophosphate ABC transporter permease n=1 Tax=Allorhizobium undicola TaxID=78527 RepID=UPI000485479B|nr:thiamine/thiamine pyrophosphate ABC transporter permease [Allorhizobium undicola]